MDGCEPGEESGAGGGGGQEEGVVVGQGMVAERGERRMDVTWEGGEEGERGRFGFGFGSGFGRLGLGLRLLGCWWFGFRRGDFAAFCWGW